MGGSGGDGTRGTCQAADWSFGAMIEQDHPQTMAPKVAPKTSGKKKFDHDLPNFLG